MSKKLGINIPIGNPPIIFSTPGSEELGNKINNILKWTPGKQIYTTFKNGEIRIRTDQQVSNGDIYVITSRNDSFSEINFTLMQLFIMLDSIKNGNPYRITVILPCLEYSRQDKRFAPGEPLTSKLLLKLIQTSGSDRIIAIDLHNGAEVGFTDPLIDELYALPYLSEFIKYNVPSFTSDNTVICATDAGGAKRSRMMADILGTGFIMADKFRSKAGEVGEVKIITDGSIGYVNVVVVDDMMDTCGTLLKVIEAIRKFNNNVNIYAVGTHGQFSGDACNNICNSDLEWIAVTNTITQDTNIEKMNNLGYKNKLKVIDISKLIAGAIIRVHYGHNLQSSNFKNIGPGDNDKYLLNTEKVPRESYILEVLGINN